jgi:hypothetical protein
MKRIAWICMVLGLVGCGKEREEKTQAQRRTTARATKAIVQAAAKVKPSAVKPKVLEPAPPYDEEEPVPTRPRMSPALQKEVDAYLAEPPLVVTASELVKAYKDEAKADDRFKERKVWVTGYVLHTSRGTLGTPYVELEPGKTESGAVRCFFDKGRSLSVEELKESQEVTIEGRVSAKTGDVIRVDSCRVLTPAALQSITAAARDRKGNRD